MERVCDAISRLSSLGITLGGSGYNQSLTFQYNPASQLSSKTATNTLYAYTGYAAKNLTYGTANSLNQIPTAGTASLTYDTRGNLASTGTGGASYGYDQENNLTSTSAGATLTYDPIDRLHTTYGSTTGTTQFLYDGSQIIAEYNSSGAVTNRYVFGPGGDEPLVWYMGSGTTTPLWTIADNRGSIIAVTNASGTPYTSSTSNGINIYDEYGVPASTNLGRFQYTGQAWVPETALYHYKARAYNPTLGRFLQTDPAGYSAGMNLYAYAGNDPINLVDPSGMDPGDDSDGIPTINVTGSIEGGGDPAIGGADLIQLINSGNNDFGNITVSGNKFHYSSPLVPNYLSAQGGGSSNDCSVSASSLDDYLSTKNSPMVGQGANLMASGAQYNIDPRLFVSLVH